MSNKKQILTITASILLSVALVAVAVKASTTIGNDISVGGDLDIVGQELQATTGILDISKSGSLTTIKGTFNVDETVTLDSTLTVTDTTTLATTTIAKLTISNLASGRIPIISTNGLISDDGDLLFSGSTLTATNITASSNLEVGGNATTTGNFTVSRNSNLATTTLSGSLTLSGVASFLSNLIVAGNTTTTGNQVISGTFNVSGTSTLATTTISSLTVSGTSTLSTTTLSGDLDLSLKQLKNAVLEKLAGFPSSPVEGQMFWSTATSVPYWYDAANSRWRTQSHAATIVVAAATSTNRWKADYICDGTDDHVEIQAAINALPSNGGLVHLQEGIYNIGANIVPVSNLILEGEGWATTLKRQATSFTDPIIRMVTGGSSVENVVIRDMEILGIKDQFGADVVQAAVYCSAGDFSNIWFDNLYIHNTQQYGIFFNGLGNVGSNIRITNCRITDTGNSTSSKIGPAIMVQKIDNILIQGNFIDNTYNLAFGAIDVNSSSSNAKIIGNHISNTDASGQTIYVEVNVEGVTIIGNTTENNGSAGIALYPCAGTYAKKIIIANNISKGDAYGIWIKGKSDTARIEEVTVTGNLIYNSALAGIDVEGNTRNLLVANNLVIMPVATGSGIKLGHHPSNNTVISSNIFINSNYSVDALDLGTPATSDGLIIKNNVFRNAAGWAIAISFFTDTIVADNIFDNNAADFYDNSIRTVRNGVGKNGSNDPASAGDWNGHCREGVMVKWDDGAGTDYMSWCVNGNWYDVVVN